MVESSPPQSTVPASDERTAIPLIRHRVSGIDVGRVIDGSRSRRGLSFLGGAQAEHLSDRLLDEAIDGDALIDSGYARATRRSGDHPTGLRRRLTRRHNPRS